MWDQDLAIKNKTAYARLRWWISSACIGESASTSSVYAPDRQVPTVVNDDSSDEDKDPVPTDQERYIKKNSKMLHKRQAL